jgi:hypothetical protein
MPSRERNVRFPYLSGVAVVLGTSHSPIRHALSCRGRSDHAPGRGAPHAPNQRLSVVGEGRHQHDFTV